MKSESEKMQVSKQETKHVEKQIVKANNMLTRLNSAYGRIKKIEIRNLFRSMREILNSYKREYGKLNISIHHVNKTVELPATFDTIVTTNNTVEKKVGKKLLISISSSKNVLLAVLHHSLPTRVYSRLKKEEDKIQKRQNQIVEKRDKLMQRLDGENSKEMVILS